MSCYKDHLIIKELQQTLLEIKYSEIQTLLITETSRAYQITNNNVEYVCCLKTYPNIWNLINYQNFLLYSPMATNYIYFEPIKGIYWKYKIGTHNASQLEINNTFIDHFIQSLIEWQQQHQTLLNKFTVLNWNCFNIPLSNNLDQLRFESLLSWEQTLPQVMAHNSLERKNIVLLKNGQYVFIDFEWVAINNIYADIAFFAYAESLQITELEYLFQCYKKIYSEISWDSFGNVLFMVAVLNYQWASEVLSQDITCDKINKYYCKALQIIKEYKSIFNNENN